MIVTTPIQVKLPTMMVTRLPSPFDENKLELWTVEFWQLQIKLYCLFKRAHLTQTRKRKRKKKLIAKEINILLSQLLFNCNTEKQG